MGFKRHDPVTLDINKQRYEMWCNTRSCPGCNSDRIHIRKIGNHGQMKRVLDCYEYGQPYFKFNCPKCQTTWHSTQLHKPVIF